MFPLLGETRIQLSIPVQSSSHTDFIAGTQVAYTRLEQIFFHGPAHEIVANGRLGDLLVQLNSLIVVFALQSD